MLWWKVGPFTKQLCLRQPRKIHFVFNRLFKLDENGLRDKVTPLIGLEYSF